MGEVVNLRQARKRAERARKDAEADANRVSFGTPKTVKAAMRRERERSASHLDGHRLSGDAQPSAEDETSSSSHE